MRAPGLNGAREDGEAVDRAANLLEETPGERGWDTDVTNGRVTEAKRRRGYAVHVRVQCRRSTFSTFPFRLTCALTIVYDCSPG